MSQKGQTKKNGPFSYRKEKTVPGKISEERFWRNYFFRVSLAMEQCSVGMPLVVDPPNEKQDSETDPKAADKVADDDNDDDLDLPGPPTENADADEGADANMFVAPARDELALFES